MDLYFSDHFKVKPRDLEKYGAFNISLVSDLPLFIDPFLLFNSKKKKYKELHESIIKYLVFLKEKAHPVFLFHLMKTIKFRHDEHKRYWISEYSKIKIPLPPLEIQKQLVAEAEKEEEIIASNRRLIDLMERKISQVLAEI